MATATMAQRPDRAQQDRPLEQGSGIPVDPREIPRPSPIYKNWDPRTVFLVFAVLALGGGLIGVLTLAVAVVDIGR